MILAPDTVLNTRYRIVRLVGQGGMGAVYEAIDERLLNRVALKQLTVQGEILSRAFKREARLLANIDHPALPDVTDHFSEGDGEYLVMEYIPGQDLAGIQQQNNQPFPVEQVLRWADQILSALEYLHSQTPPIFHRDIKPQNLKLKPSGDIMLLDFGLAKGANFDVTRISKLSGYTPGFSSPEQIEDAGTDERSELYSVAATLHHFLTNGTPIDAMTRLRAAAGKRPDPLRSAHDINPNIPLALSAVLEQALSLEPDDRPQSASAMRTALRQARIAPSTEFDQEYKPVPISQHTEIDPASVAPIATPHPSQRQSQPTEVEPGPSGRPSQPTEIEHGPSGLQSQPRPVVTPTPATPQAKTSRTPWTCLAIGGGAVLVLGIIFAVAAVSFLNRISSIVDSPQVASAIAGGLDPVLTPVGDVTPTSESIATAVASIVPVEAAATEPVAVVEPTTEAAPEPTVAEEEPTPTTQPTRRPARTAVYFPTFTPRQQLGSNGASGDGNTDNVNVPAVLSANFDTVEVGSSFDTDSTIWPVTNEADFSVGVVDGMYSMTLTAPQQYLTSRPDQPSDTTDSGISSEVRIDDDDAFGGLLVRYSETDGKRNMVMCWISRAQEYGCSKSIDNEWTELVKVATEPTIKANGVNRVVLTARGEQFVFIINGKQIARFKDGSLKQGTSGLYIENFEKPITVRFDDVVIVTP